MVRDAESHAAKDKERKAQIEAKNEAETSIYSAEKSIADYKDKVPYLAPGVFGDGCAVRFVLHCDILTASLTTAKVCFCD